MRKRGISPVIATVLLIAMVIVIGLIVFLWFRGLTQEAVTKFGGTNIELICEDILFDASYSSGTLYISNTGNVPIYSMKLKIQQGGNYETKDLSELSSSWPVAGINQGGVFSGKVSLSSGADEITITPVLIGSSDEGKRTYTCNANRYGKELVI